MKHIAMQCYEQLSTDDNETNALAARVFIYVSGVRGCMGMMGDRLGIMRVYDGDHGEW